MRRLEHPQNFGLQNFADGATLVTSSREDLVMATAVL